MGIISGRIHGWQTLLGLIDIGVAVALYGAVFAACEQRSDLVPGFYGTYLIMVVLALFAANSWSIRRVGVVSAVAESHLVRLTIGKSAVVAFVLFGYLVAFRDHAVSRSFLFAYLILLPVVLIVFRLLANRYVMPLIFHRKNGFGILVLGKPAVGEPLLSWLLSKKNMGIHVLGYLSTPDTAEPVEIPYLGSIDELGWTVKRTDAQLIVSLSLPATSEEAAFLRDKCDRLGVRLAYHCCLGGSASRVTICQGNGVSLLSVRNEPLQNPFNRCIKRLFDLVVAIPVVLFVLPWLCAMVWLIHRLRSPGPLFFRQKRGGLGGRPFRMFKFRTMHCQSRDESVQAAHRDERVFRGGHWLRKFSIDEFPQFLNVIAGDMSLVGPRPHLEAHDEAFSEISPEYRVRSLVKPGITGLAQVEGHRGPTPESRHVHARVRADVHYLENWTLSLDLVVVMRTFIQLVRPKNAV